MSLEGYEKAKHQAAGHDGALTDASGLLFIKPTTQQEVEFYTHAQTDDGNNEAESKLSDWMPVFMGTLESGISNNAHNTNKITPELEEINKKQDHSNDKPYLVLQNLLYGFNNPSIIDIKLGSILHDENTSDEKIKRLNDVSKTTTSGSLNYRVCGMKLFHNDLPSLSPFNENSIKQVTKDNDGYIKFDKWFGRDLTSNNIIEAFKLFFNHNNLNIDQRTRIIRNTFTRLQLLYNCLLDNEITIRSGSLFFAYENDTKRWNELNDDDPIFKDDLPFDDNDDEDEDDVDDSNKSPLAPLSILSLIDFAHAKFTPGKTDDNLLKGIENLLESLESLLD